jgi:adenylate cyclase
MGDGVFVEFRAPDDAVRCSIALQQAMVEYNRDRPSVRRIQFRIGINCGDVIVDDEDRDQNLYGTDVNIAARLQQIADVGGIWVSERVASEVDDADDFSFRPLGARRLKNVAGRVPVFEVRWGDKRSRDAGDAHDMTVTRSTNPAIVILPFEDLADAKSEAHVGRAIVEDVMTELGRFTDISIISPESASLYGDSSLSVREIGRRLNADYVVSGAVLRHASEIRLSTKLFETQAGEQIWANRYDGNLKDVFEMQDTIARDLAFRLPLRVEDLDLQRSRRKPIENLDAYDCYIRGRALYRLKDRSSDDEAVQLLKRAVELDPEFAAPYAILGAIHGIQWSYSSWGIDPREQILEGRRLIREALRLNNNLPRAHGHLGWTYLSMQQFDKASASFEKAVSLNPNDADVLLLRAYALVYMGEPLESIRICNELMELNPHFPLWYKDVIAGAQFVAGQYDKSLESMEEIIDMFPESVGWLAACQAKLGLARQARISADLFVDRARTVWKGPSDAGPSEIIGWFLKHACPFKIARDRDNLSDGLRKAGLPEADAP